MTPPTDKLYKFLAIGGIVLFVFGITVPLDHYNKYEIQRIQAIEKVNELLYAQSEFAREVNHQIEKFNEAKESGDIEALENVAREVLKLEPKIRQIEKNVQNKIVQSLKHSQLLSHYELMKNIWFATGIASVFAGILISVVGFKLWYNDTKDMSNG